MNIVWVSLWDFVEGRTTKMCPWYPELDHDEQRAEGQKLTDKTLLDVFPGGTEDKNPPAGHTDLIPGPGRFHIP